MPENKTITRLIHALYQLSYIPEFRGGRTRTGNIMFPEELVTYATGTRRWAPREQGDVGDVSALPLSYRSLSTERESNPRLSFSRGSNRHLRNGELRFSCDDRARTGVPMRDRSNMSEVPAVASQRPAESPRWHIRQSTATAKLSHVTTIAETHTLTHDELNAAWELYYTTFEEVNALAVQKHIMTWEDFSDVMDDLRVRKYVATDEHGITGLSVMTNTLEAWPLISPAFFERRWPKNVKAGNIWYVGFVAVRQDPKPERGTFAEIIKTMYQPVIDSGGFAVMDYCLHNVLTRGLPQASLRILERINPAVSSIVIDAQYFYGYRFDGQPW